MSSNAAVLPQGKPGAEPSMEEILASIRRIIADDTLGTKKDEPVAAPPPAVPEPQVAMVDDDDSDVLDLADVATITSEIADVMIDDPVMDQDEELGFDPIPVVMDVSPTPPPMISPPMPPVQPVMMMPPMPVQQPQVPLNTVAALEDHILSNETGSLVTSAFQSLQRNISVPQSKSLEEIVVEMIRPMLRGWLDDHLPGIVEKLVKAEIERVARGG